MSSRETCLGKSLEVKKGMSFGETVSGSPWLKYGLQRKRDGAYAEVVGRGQAGFGVWILS